ncbi:hypothetical protein [Nocardiopsis rhodophaea]|uniref:hypothetical protein n=1 Tax=Nocardiopsis rhodophaea TaxID=280238 RepID=UPI0031D0E36E
MIFVERFREIIEATGWRDLRTPFRAIEAWKQFVDDCVDGYSYGMADYCNDLSIRGLLQTIIDDSVIRSTPQCEWYEGEVRKVDDVFRSLIDSGVEVRSHGEWWERKIPAFGSREMKLEAEEMYGVVIEEI